MRNKQRLTLPALALAVTLCAQNPATTASIASKLDTPQVRVYVATLQPRTPSVSRTGHATNRLLIYLDNGVMTRQEGNEKIQNIEFHRGDVRWRPASGAYVAENISDHPIRILEIDLKSKPAGPAPVSKLDPAVVDARHYRVEFENDQVRVLRIHYDAHDKGVEHEHILNRVVFYLNDQNGAKADDVRMAGAATHTEQNAGDQPADRIAVELKAAAPTTAWIPGRTPDGQPDIQGVWTNPTLTPFERPARLAGKATLTEEEATEIERRAASAKTNEHAEPGDIGSYNQAWFDSGTKVVGTRQTSLVVEPADGRVPLSKTAEEIHANDIAHEGDSWEHMTLWDRCISRGVPGGMFPAGYNNAYQIIQTAGFVVIAYEMIHEAHIIPLTNQHLPPTARQLSGDSIGRWEGNTLVVDTSNYNGRGQIATSAATGRIRGVKESSQLHVVERFTRTNADTIMYEARIEDPVMYTGPWKVSMPLTRDDNYTIYEYACHEGNSAVQRILEAGRATEKAAQRR